MSTLDNDAPATIAKSREGREEVLASLSETSGAHVLGRAVTINRQRAERFAYWRDLSNLPSFMD